MCEKEIWFDLSHSGHVMFKTTQNHDTTWYFILKQNTTWRLWSFGLQLIFRPGMQPCDEKSAMQVTRQQVTLLGGGGGVCVCNFSIWSHPRAKSQCFRPHADKEERLRALIDFMDEWEHGGTGNSEHNAGQMSPHGAQPWTLPPIYLSRTVHKRLIQCVGAETLADVGVSCLCRDVAENQLTLDPSYFLGWCHLKMDSVRLWND